MSPHIVLVQTAHRQRFAKMMWRSVGLQPWGGYGEITMTEVLNEVSRGEPDQFAPSSDVALRIVVSQKIVPSPEQLADRDRGYELRARQSLTAAFLVILCRVDRHSFGGELNKSESAVRARLRHRGAPMTISVANVLLFSCLVFLVTGIVIAATSLL